MTKINLLPWREERRQELKRQFFMILAGMVLVGGGLVYLMDMNVKAQIENQTRRNDFVTQETRKLDAQIKEISELKKQRESLIERMKVIQDLQGNRPVIVQIFDEMVRTVPDGVFYEKVKSTGDSISVTGIAESNNRVSNLMRNLDASPLLEKPSLSKVKSTEGEKDQAANEFDLTVQRQKPDEEKDS
ncbi:MAG TPA: PilN domain-containing protein [Dongiaceae bacterium]|nr:PilN domain-containing protein [Dongiaceae bacterium]